MTWLNPPRLHVSARDISRQGWPILPPSISPRFRYKHVHYRRFLPAGGTPSAHWGRSGDLWQFGAHVAHSHDRRTSAPGARTPGRLRHFSTGKCPTHPRAQLVPFESLTTYDDFPCPLRNFHDLRRFVVLWATCATWAITGPSLRPPLAYHCLSVVRPRPQAPLSSSFHPRQLTLILLPCQTSENPDRKLPTRSTRYPQILVKTHFSS
jgi:hypothetical protein